MPTPYEVFNHIMEHADVLFAIFAFIELYWLIPFFIFLAIGAITFGSDIESIWGDAPWVSALFVLGLLYMAGWIPLPVSLTNIYSLLIGIGCYFALGMGWSLYKWFLLLRKLKDIILAAIPTARDEMAYAVKHSTYRKEESLSYFILEMRQIRNYLDKEDISKDGIVKPSVKHARNKGRVTAWVLFWPFSVVNYIFGKLLQDLVDFLVRIFREFYGAISKAMFSDVVVK